METASNTVEETDTVKHKVKQCKCGSATHIRVNSNEYPLKKQKEPTHGPDEEKEIFVIKCFLKNICRNAKLIDQISLITAHTTKVMWLLTKGEEVPIMSQNDIYSIFTVVTVKKMYIMEEKLVTVASKLYINRRLKELTFTSILNRRSFKSLQEQVLQSINSNVPLILGRKLSKAKLHLPALETLVTSVKSRIADETFTCEKFTNKRGYRVFTLLPIYSFKTKLVQIDATAFWRLVKESNIENYPKSTKIEPDLLGFYYKLFDFSKLGFRSRKESFTRKKAVQAKKQPADFLEDIENGCIVWRVDPGVNTIFTAVDTPGRQRTTSLDEYYHLCGYNDATFIQNQHQKQHMAEYSKISNLSSLKTSIIKDFIKACKERLALYDDIKKYYNENNWKSKLKFQYYMKKQKGVHEICERFVYNSSKYHQKSSTGVKSAIDNFTRQQVVASQNYYKSAEEYKIRKVENVVTKKSKRRVHTILQCQQNICNIVSNCDIMAAHNILDMFLFASKNNNQRPSQFKRKDATIDEPSPLYIFKDARKSIRLKNIRKLFSTVKIENEL
ncbi:uncharacterized protein BX663DRAFT_489525 [Cokeromyces recurvatus]|uniref:uncharacterized protein n=1 Tax=Cokeromyces recurvatus TaxID=90255 RepID=UPI00222079A6|nr:uncharacterized protein BX663DRAFT_489525 [Cokeromyces recurvatus]KAI7898956.1 hypothetical protein BX663DRAFT_489525 [Cokeromyces recurvatus]